MEIQEPTVIRDAAVLMALNSALEPDGSLNLPTRIVHRHPDFIAVITTNRGYNGYRPLNEALRDRVQHAEKLDLPHKEVMMERVKAKTGYQSANVLSLLAETIMLLDETARANAIKGVAGMRSYIFWVDAVQSGASVQNTLYHKVLYKITTDPQELAILEQALVSHGLTDKLEELDIIFHSQYEFCTGCGIPIMVYGDTADRSKLEQMSVYAYVDFKSKDADEKYALMNIQARSNNRDGMALRIISDRLLNAPQRTKLIISISDGQPKAMPDYTGEKASSS